jgi:plasmid stability protein
MSAITVRNLDPEVQRRIKQRAAAHNRSMEAEARAILGAAVAGSDLAAAWIAVTEQFRGDDLALPARSTPRDLDLA